MAMASRALAPPALHGFEIRGAWGNGRSWWDTRHRCSVLESRCVLQKLPGGRRSSLRTGNSGLPAVTPGWTHQVCSALQTGAIIEESGLEQELEKLKELVDLQGGNSKDADDQELLRFLRAKSLDTENAAIAFVSHQKWREEFVPNGYFIEADLPEELNAKKAYFISKDKKGRPVMLSTGRDHVYNKKDFDQFKRFVVYTFDRLIRAAPPDAEQFIAIVDLKGLGLKNLDSKSFIAAFDIVQNHYPLRLDKIFMINVPLIFNGVWKVVKPFIDEDTRNRVTFVDKNKIVETLTNEIDIEYLPKEYGGNADLVPLQDAVTPNWPPSS
jgi:hypothetical protein